MVIGEILQQETPYIINLKCDRDQMPMYKLVFQKIFLCFTISISFLKYFYFQNYVLSLLYNYRLCCVMENTEIWLADKCVKISAISTWMSFLIRMNVILTRNAGTTTVLPGETRIHSSRVEPEKTIDSKSIKPSTVWPSDDM